MTFVEQIAFDKINPAVESQIMIEFWYKSKTDQNGHYRIVEPYMIYINDLDNAVLSAWYKPHGIYTINKDGGGRTYLLSGMSRIEILDKKFDTVRSGYNPDTLMTKEILCFVSVDD